MNNSEKKCMDDVLLAANDRLMVPNTSAIVMRRLTTAEETKSGLS